MDEGTWLLLQIALLLALLVFLLRLLFSLRHTRSSIRLLLRGDHAEALPFCRAASKSWPPSLAIAGAYNVALCLHHLGHLDDAEIALREVIAQKPKGMIDGLAHGLLGATRALGEKHGPETERLIRRGREVFPHPSDWLWLGHAALARGERAEADALIARALTEDGQTSGRIGWISARVDAVGLQALEGYLVGSYREKCGDRDAALAAYLTAASAPRRSIYVSRARAGVERLRRAGVTSPAVTLDPPPEDEDALGPFVSDGS